MEIIIIKTTLETFFPSSKAHILITCVLLLATVVDDSVFIDATMSRGLRNTCKLFEEDFMKAFVKGLVHHHPSLFSDEFGPLVDNYLDDI